MSEINVKAKLDTSELERKEAEWRTRLRRLNKNVDEFEFNARRAAMRGMTAISSTAYTIQAIFSLVPGVIKPAAQAVITTVTTVVSSLHAIAAAYAAGGVTAWMAGIVESAAIGLSIAGLGAYFAGQHQTEQELRKMNSVLRRLGTATTSWGRAAQAWGE